MYISRKDLHNVYLTSITSHRYRLFLVMRASVNYSIRNLQIYNIVSLITLTRSYITSPGFIDFIPGITYHFWRCIAWLFFLCSFNRNMTSMPAYTRMLNFLAFFYMPCPSNYLLNLPTSHGHYSTAVAENTVISLLSYSNGLAQVDSVPFVLSYNLPSKFHLYWSVFQFLTFPIVSLLFFWWDITYFW